MIQLLIAILLDLWWIRKIQCCFRFLQFIPQPLNCFMMSLPCHGSSNHQEAAKPSNATYGGHHGSTVRFVSHFFRRVMSHECKIVFLTATPMTSGHHGSFGDLGVDKVGMMGIQSAYAEPSLTSERRATRKASTSLFSKSFSWRWQIASTCTLLDQFQRNHPAGYVPDCLVGGFNPCHAMIRIRDPKEIVL